MNEYDLNFVRLVLDKFGLDPNIIRDQINAVAAAVAQNHQQTTKTLGDISMALVKVQEEDLVALKASVAESHVKVDAMAAVIADASGDIDELKAKIEELINLYPDSPLAIEAKDMAASLSEKLSATGASIQAVADKVPEPAPEPEPTPEPAPEPAPENPPAA